MSEMNWKYALGLNEFDRTMLKKLRTGRGKRSWLDEDTASLLRKLKAEVEELSDALKSGGIQAVQDECADVANFAFFIHDYVGELGLDRTS